MPGKNNLPGAMGEGDADRAAGLAFAAWRWQPFAEMSHHNLLEQNPSMDFFLNCSDKWAGPNKTVNPMAADASSLLFFAFPD